MKKRIPLLTGILFLFAVSSLFGAGEVELIWPKGTEGVRDSDAPTLTFFLPPAEKETRTAVIVCPGGGYGALAMDHEGYKVAEWLNSLGVAAFVLKYRHSGTGYKHPAPMEDVQRAIRIIRSRADRLHINNRRIGVMGFSAGGHLAATAGTYFKDEKKDLKNRFGKVVNSRPDFMILIYPVITMKEPYTHKGSVRNLLGNNPSEKMIEYMSNEMQVTPDTPPAFLVHTSEDKSVPAENSVNFYLALRKAGVSAEMHIYKEGRHGFGLGVDGGAVSGWPKQCEEWLRWKGLLEKEAK